MSKFANWIKTETPAISAVVSAALALILGLGAPLSTVQTGAIEAGVVAALALLSGVLVRPFALSALTGFVTAAATLLAAFGFHFHGGDSGQHIVSMVNALITTLFALLVRPQVVDLATYKAKKAAAKARARSGTHAAA